MLVVQRAHQLAEDSIDGSPGYLWIYGDHGKLQRACPPHRNPQTPRFYEPVFLVRTKCAQQAGKIVLHGLRERGEVDFPLGVLSPAPVPLEPNERGEDLFLVLRLLVAGSQAGNS